MEKVAVLTQKILYPVTLLAELGLGGLHPFLAEIIDFKILRHGVLAIRAGHHCNQPLLAKLGVQATARASFNFYNTESEVDRFIEVIHQVRKMFV